MATIYRHRLPKGETVFDKDKAFELARPTGEWQEFEITVAGDSLLVKLNGTLLTRARDLVNSTGHIGLQGETSIVEFRSIAIKELE